MSRFRRLEFGDEDPQRSAPEAPGAQRVEYWLQQARAAREMGLYENALRFYTRSVELNHNAPEAWLGQVQCLILLDELLEARTWARKALDRLKSGADLLAALAQAELRLGRGSTAHGLVNRAFEAPGESAYRWMVRGELFTVARLDQGGHCFERALAISKDWLNALEIALALEYHEFLPQAHRYAITAVKERADAPYAWLVRARIELQLGLDEAAKNSALQALQLKPGYREATEILRQVERPRAFHWLRRLLRG